MGLFDNILGNKDKRIDWNDTALLKSMGMEEFYIQNGRANKIIFCFV